MNDLLKQIENEIIGLLDLEYGDLIHHKEDAKAEVVVDAISIVNSIFDKYKQKIESF